MHHPRTQHPPGNCRLWRWHRKCGAVRMRIPMMLKSISVSLLLVILGEGLMFAQSKPTPESAGHLEILGFTLGKSTLAEVETKLGKSAATKCSREEEASKEVCYLGVEGQTRVV